MTEELKLNKFKVRYPRKDLFMIVFREENGNPCSYKRAYEKTYNKYLDIMEVVDKFYQTYETTEPNIVNKLTVNNILASLKIDKNLLLKHLQVMAGTISVVKRKSIGGFEKILPHPFSILIQQDPKSDVQSNWGKRTPIYILKDNKRGRNL